MTTVSLRSTSPTSINADAIVVGVQSAGESLVVAPGGEALSEAFGGFADLLKTLDVSSKPGDVTKVSGGGATKAPLVLVAGLGESGEVAPETLRRAAGAAVRAASKAKTVALALPVPTDDHVRAVAEGALLGSYTFDRYLGKKNGAAGEVVVLSERARAKGTAAAVDGARIVTDAVNFARDLVNTPPNDLYPESFVAELRDRGRALRTGKVTINVLDERALTTKGYGGILGVGKGSARPPRLAKLSYRPARAIGHLALVGKGITFDSGGLSIKTGAGMMTMKCDMAGAAAISAAVFAIAELGLPIRVTGYACLAENMPSGGATRPGDVLTMFGGKTVEVLNTDAEGRLVLADGITTANGDKPDAIIDVATLTGACMVALGRNTYGVFSNDDGLRDDITAAAERAGEPMWALPIPEEMKEKVTSTKIADLGQHNPEPWGGALYAAAFLREFVGDGIAWAHLDIAGPAFNEGNPSGYTPKGGTGTAVRTLVELARARSQG